MVDCSLCKHHYLKHLGKYSAISDCERGHFLLFNGEIQTPDECLDFESLLPETQVAPIGGIKYDTGKNRMGLMCENFSRALWEVAKVSTFGANRYGANNWQYLENPKERYMDALCRHLFQHLQGEKINEESGLLHLSHCAWNILALLEFELREREKEKEDDLTLKKLKEQLFGICEKESEDNNAK